MSTDLIRKQAKMLEKVIKTNDKGQRVDKFLGKVMVNCSKSMIYKWIRLKKIKVNRKKCEINQILEENDIVQFFIPHHFIKTQDYQFLNTTIKLMVEYENDDFIVVWKPKGLLVHENNQEKNDTLVNAVLKYLYESKKYNPELENSFTPASIHRLDRNTEGYVVFAKNYEALKDLNDLMKQHLIQKKYIAIIENLKDYANTLIDYHYKDEKGNVSISSTPKTGYKRIETKYKVLASKGKFKLVEIELVTGKSHQIRAQFAHHQSPLYGDKRYHAKSGKEYQSLCAYALSFNFKKDYDFVKKDNTVTKQFEKL